MHQVKTLLRGGGSKDDAAITAMPATLGSEAIVCLAMLAPGPDPGTHSHHID